MPTLIENVRGFLARSGLLARDNPLSFDQWLAYFTFNGTGYGAVMPTQSLSSKQEHPYGGYENYVKMIYKQNGIVFACMVARMLPFSEARFQWRRRVDGRPGALFGTPALEILEHPWANATTGDLLSRALQDADIGGNFFACRRGGVIRRLRPDWMTIVVGSKSEPDDPQWAIDAEIIGYIHQPLGPGSAGRTPEVLLPSEVAHFAPIPDPAFRFRGMSWLTPILAEVMGDNAATQHKLKFFENGATPNMIVSLDKSITKEAYDAFLKKMKEEQTGVLNAYRTLYLGGGSTATVVGANMRQIDFKVTQGAGETRIAAAARIPPIIVGLSEGLQAATYSNYGQARRAFADGTLRPLWRNIAGSLEHLIDGKPGNAELWYDDRDIPFLQEDQKDAADIVHVRAQGIRQLVDAGFEPPSVIAAIEAGDLTLLKHTGLYSVQLQSPGSKKLPEAKPGEGPAAEPTTPLPPAAPAPLAIAPPKRDDAPELETEPQTTDGAMTDRERTVVGLIAAGLTNKEVGVRIDASERTVERTVASAMRKLGVKTRTELAIVIDVRHDDGATAEAIVKTADAMGEVARSTAAVADAVTRPRTTKTTVQKRDEKGRLAVAVAEES